MFLWPVEIEPAVEEPRLVETATAFLEIEHETISLVIRDSERNIQVRSAIEPLSERPTGHPNFDLGYGAVYEFDGKVNVDFELTPHHFWRATFSLKEVHDLLEFVSQTDPRTDIDDEEVDQDICGVKNMKVN